MQPPDHATESTSEATMVTCYTNPDLDGFGGAVAYAELLNKKGQEAVVGVFGTPRVEPRFVMERFGFEYPKPIVTHIEQFKKVILVDASDLHGIDKRINPANVIEVIDHRDVHEARNFPNAHFQMERVGAAATLIAEHWQTTSFHPTVKAATLMYTAIISNTLNFRAKVTTDRDHSASEWLKHYTSIPENFFEEMFEAKSNVSGNALAEQLEGDFAYFVFGKSKIGIAQLELIGARRIAAERDKEVIATLNIMQHRYALKNVFASIIDLKETKNYFIVPDENMRTLLSELLHITFNDMVAIRDEPIMRKEIVPLLKKRLENDQSE